MPGPSLRPSGVSRSFVSRGRPDPRREATRRATPWSQGPATVPGPDRAGLADEDEERRLEGILGVVMIGQQAAADAQDHRAMPRHQRRESRLLSAVEVTLQELAIGQSRPVG